MHKETKDKIYISYKHDGANFSINIFMLNYFKNEFKKLCSWITYENL